MDTLQIVLLVACVFAVAGVVAFNKWQESRHRNRANRAFPGNQRDPLLERGMDSGFLSELPSQPPVKRKERASRYDEDPAPEEKAPKLVEVKRSPLTQPPTPRQRAQPPLPDKLDHRVDCCIRIESVEPIEVPRLWAAQAEAFGGIERPLRWYAFDDRENQWRRVGGNTVGTHHWFLSALQLVDRGGMVSESEFVRYVRGVQRISDQFHAVPAALPSKADVLNNAKLLDSFCAEVDVQIAINLVAVQPMSVSKLATLAENEGLRLEGDGVFHARAADNRTLYVLSNGESAPFERSTLADMRTRRLSLILDLPRVLDAASEFEDMMRFATRLASSLGAGVVDDNGRAFGTESVDAIRDRIRRYQMRMSEENIPPGGSLARRLFTA